MVLPFEERVDWEKLAIKWPQADVARLPTFLLGMSQADIHARIKRAVSALYDEFSVEIAKELSLAEVGLTLDEVNNEFKRGLRCKFWFLRADKLCDYEGATGALTQLMMQARLAKAHHDQYEQHASMDAIVQTKSC